MRLARPLRTLKLRRAYQLLALGLVAVTVGGYVAATAPSARAVTGTEMSLGFDSCGLPSTSQMSTWWSASPYYWIGVYIGGSDQSCGNPGSSWVSTVTTAGWGVEPIWVGPQNPCWGGSGATFSTNTSTAYSQGETQASDAIGALATAGFAPLAGNWNDSVVYDMEAYSQTSTCIAAAQAFISGWSAQLGIPPVQAVGVYGSTCGSDLNAFASSSPVPYFIWGADWDGNSNVSVMTCVTPGWWGGPQRLKQYSGNVNQTYGGVTLYIDADGADAPVYF
ncbi:MAG TPA: DUF1906 domain-containing protein [Solirubrobacteraceae bacterium]|jgi:hypothetical protein